MEFQEKRPELFENTLYEASIPSEVAAKNPVIDAILALLDERGHVTTKDDQMNVRLVLEEAIINGIKHGNNLDPEKNVKIYLGESPGGWGVGVEDQGDGFSPDDLPDPDDPASLFLEGGRGVFLMDHFGDRLIYYNGGRGMVFFKQSKNDK